MRGEYRFRALLHALRFRREAFSSLVEGHPVPGPDGLPLPPPLFIESVAGNVDVPWFLEGGARGHRSLLAALEGVGVQRSDLRRVLDFGCGCGRVARYWRAGTDGDGVELVGVDQNRYLAGWCSRNLPFGRFRGISGRPPLREPSGSFDLIYALSVLTHMPEPLQRGWLAEFARMLRPGAHLVVSIHGDAAIARLPEELRADFAAGRAAASPLGASGSNDFNVYHPRAYLEALVSPWFETAAFLPEGALGNPPQDLYVLRKPRL